jgi:hypothetical protein
MMGAGGHWQCAFFDREPHALFGEDVKTRNAIVFHFSRAGETNLSVTQLHKWTSRTRHQLFSTLDFIDLGTFDFASGIPKLGSIEEANAFLVLSKKHSAIGNLATRIYTCLPIEAHKRQQTPRLFVASTAYNFLNVFRPFNTVSEDYPFSENKVHCFEFASDDDAWLAFAILSSRLAFWLWHTIGDGFHVGAKFLKQLPFDRDSCDSKTQTKLERLGHELWHLLENHRIVSVNRGRQTIAFRPLACVGERDEIDRLLVHASRLPGHFSDMLRSFVERTVVVDRTDNRRSHLSRLFNKLEISS